jgi:hypothetical protein
MSDRLAEELRVALEAANAVKGTDSSVASQETPVVVESESKPALTEVEQKAYEMGWRPKGDYQGEHFVEAAEYVNRAPLFERIEKQTKELRELRDLARKNNEGLAKIRKEEYDRAMRELESRKLQSVQIGDVENYKKIELQKQEIQKQMQADPIVTDQPMADPAAELALNDFMKRNSTWIAKDKLDAESEEMREAATFIENKIIKQSNEKGIKLSPNEQLKMVEDKIKKLYPHRFENVNTEKPAMVSTSTASKTSGVSVSNLIGRLSPQQREFGAYFQKHNPSYTLEKYAADLERQGNLGK